MASVAKMMTAVCNSQKSARGYENHAIKKFGVAVGTDNRGGAAGCSVELPALCIHTSSQSWCCKRFQGANRAVI